MIFLIEYDRKNGRLIRMDRFQDSEADRAAKRRLDIELELNRKKIIHEVVLLQAETEDALRQTHRRYFKTATQIATSS